MTDELFKNVSADIPPLVAARMRVDKLRAEVKEAAEEIGMSDPRFKKILEDFFTATERLKELERKELEERKG